MHVVGWSLGGIFALLTAADQPDLPIASLTVVGSPVDVKQVPLVAPLRPLLNLDRRAAALITRAYQAMGGAPKPLVQLGVPARRRSRSWSPSRWRSLTHLDDEDFLAQLEAVDRFTDDMIAYPGRTFGQLYHRFVKGNALVDGQRSSSATGPSSWPTITAPVLVFAGATDGIAPIAAVKAVVPLLTGSPEVRFEIVPGGHLGMLTGRGARGTTWRVLDEWIEQWSSGRRQEGRHGRRHRPRRRRPRRRRPRRRCEEGRRAATSIGANPKRRYGSAGSRSLAR